MYWRDKVLLDSRICRRLVKALKNESCTVGVGGGDEAVELVLLRTVVCELDETFADDLDDGGLTEVEAEGLLLGVLCIVAFSLLVCDVEELEAVAEVLSLDPDEDGVGILTLTLTGGSTEAETEDLGLRISTDGAVVCFAAVATEEAFGMAEMDRSPKLVD